ncbi:MAG TPA: site-2 protease family protein [Candidatus Acidoferrum sp.]|jgi:Zn-dependent protease|nr:site-2 protease family protein [Candidatus Acidoferrum sp.]
MDERNPFPPQGGDSLPPPPPPIYPVTSDIPPDSPYHASPNPPVRRNRGLLGGLGALVVAALAYGKYVFLILLKVPALLTVGTALVSVAAYSLIPGIGPWVAVGLVVMIFVHEMGHVVEIRRQGMHATAPIFIPFLGAAIFQRSHAQSPMRQAQIGIAGPIAGTVGATVALVLYNETQWPVLLLWAYYGFLINLFNMIPFGMLDGGWILAPTSKWVQVAGLVALAYGWFAGLISPLIIIILVIGLPMVWQRFRNPALDAYLTSGPPGPRIAMGLAWLGLVGYLAFFFLQTEQMLTPFLR